MMWKKEFVAKSESPTTAIRDRPVTRTGTAGPAAARAPFGPKRIAAASPGATGRRVAITISVFGPGTSRPRRNSTRSGRVCAQLFVDELRIGTTVVPGTRLSVGESERTPGKKGSGRSTVTRRGVRLGQAG